MHDSTGNVPDQAEEQRGDEYRPSAVNAGQRLPYQRRDAEDGDKDRDEVACVLHRYLKVIGDGDKGTLDGRCGEEADERVESDEEEVQVFLRAVRRFATGHCLWTATHLGS